MYFHYADEVSYVGLVYYEWKLTEYLMTFVAGKKGTKLIQVISIVPTLF